MTLFKFIKFILVALSLLILGIIIINSKWFDEELHPDLVSYIETAAPVVSSDNGMAIVWGFSVENSKDPEMAGLKILQQLKDSIREPVWTEPHPSLAKDIRSTAEDRSLFEFVQCNPRLMEKCEFKNLTLVIKNERYQRLKQRYLKLREKELFDSGRLLSFQTEIPNYGQIMWMSRLVLGEAKLTQSIDKYISEIELDVEMWKQFIFQDKFLIGRIVGLASIWYEIQLASDLMKTESLTSEQTERLLSIFEPFKTEQLDLSSAYITEVLSIYYSLEKLEPGIFADFAVSDISYYFSFQENATVNLAYRSVRELNEIASKREPNEFYRAIQEYKEIGNEVFSTGFSIFDMYNWEGKRAYNRYPYNHDYYARLHDMNNMLVLLRTFSELQLVRNADDNEIGSLLNQVNTKNAYTNQPFEYFSERNTIGFQCLDESSICELEL